MTLELKYFVRGQSPRNVRDGMRNPFSILHHIPRTTRFAAYIETKHRSWHPQSWASHFGTVTSTDSTSASQELA